MPSWSIGRRLPAANTPQRPFWESTCCLLCGSDRWTPVKDAPPFIDGSEHCQVVRCRDCDLTYTNRRPSAGTIHCFYDNYLPHQSCGMSPREHLRATRRFRIKHFWKSYSPRRDGLPLVGQSRLLDFGCGGGAFLERMHRLGWQVVGLDNSSRVIEQVREKLRLRAFVGTLPHPELASERFEAVSMWHSLEHVHQPLEALTSMERVDAGRKARRGRSERRWCPAALVWAGLVLLEFADPPYSFHGRYPAGDGRTSGLPDAKRADARTN